MLLNSKRRANRAQFVETGKIDLMHVEMIKTTDGLSATSKIV